MSAASKVRLHKGRGGTNAHDDEQTKAFEASVPVPTTFLLTLYQFLLQIAKYTMLFIQPYVLLLAIFCSLRCMVL